MEHETDYDEELDLYVNHVCEDMELLSSALIDHTLTNDDIELLSMMYRQCPEEIKMVFRANFHTRLKEYTDEKFICNSREQEQTFYESDPEC